MRLSLQAEIDFTEYLLRHESDIAWDINDFGNLRLVFKEVCDREAKK